MDGMGTKLFSDQIRDADNASGMSRYAICKAIDFNQGAMSRFMSGKGGMSLEMLDRLAELLRLSVTAERPDDKLGEGVRWHRSARRGASGTTATPTPTG